MTDIFFQMCLTSDNEFIIGYMLLHKSKGGGIHPEIHNNNRSDIFQGDFLSVGCIQSDSFDRKFR